jgi:hypothetical protein
MLNTLRDPVVIAWMQGTTEEIMNAPGLDPYPVPASSIELTGVGPLSRKRKPLEQLSSLNRHKQARPLLGRSHDRGHEIDARRGRFPGERVGLRSQSQKILDSVAEALPDRPATANISAYITPLISFSAVELTEATALSQLPSRVSESSSPTSPSKKGCSHSPAKTIVDLPAAIPPASYLQLGFPSNELPAHGLQLHRNILRTGKSDYKRHYPPLRTLQ